MLLLSQCAVRESRKIAKLWFAGERRGLKVVGYKANAEIQLQLLEIRETCSALR